MNAEVKFHNIKRIEDNKDGTVTIIYSLPLSMYKDMPMRDRPKLGQLYKITVLKGQLVNLYI